jgi:hypothetical protein
LKKRIWGETAMIRYLKKPFSPDEKGFFVLGIFGT